MTPLVRTAAGVAARVMPPPQRWLELSIYVPHEYVEPIAQLFTRHGEGVVIEETGGYHPDSGERPSSTGATLRTYLPVVPEADLRRELIHIGVRLIRQFCPASELRERDVADTEWQESWKKHFSVLRVGHRLVVAAPFHRTDLEAEPSSGDLVIIIDPGLAFGTGRHPTTRRCLELLERHVAPGCRVLDVGTGSAILAIAAAKLGARSVIGMEVDEVALTSGRSNVQANGVASGVRLHLGSLPHADVHPGSVDLIVANLYAHLLVQLAPELRRALGCDGQLVASGILGGQLDDVEQAFRSVGLTPKERFTDDDWRTVLLAPRDQ